MDIKSAFLNGKLDKDVYMELPEGVEGIIGKICKLIRSLYGLKQVPRKWYQHIDEFLVNQQGFLRLEADFGIYIRCMENSLIIIVIYVDDLLLLTNTKKIMTEIKDILSKEFEMTNCGEIHYFLGIQVKRNRTLWTISLSQEHYANQIVQKFKMTDTKPSYIPLDISTKLTMANKDNKFDRTFFRQ